MSWPLQELETLEQWLSGVSKATLPTMTGLVISISGLFAITFLERYINTKTTRKIKVFDND